MSFIPVTMLEKLACNLFFSFFVEVGLIPDEVDPTHFILNFGYKPIIMVANHTIFLNFGYHLLSNNRVSAERFQRDVFFSKIEAIYRYNYILKIRS